MQYAAKPGQETEFAAWNLKYVVLSGAFPDDSQNPFGILVNDMPPDGGAPSGNNHYAARPGQETEFAAWNLKYVVLSGAYPDDSQNPFGILVNDTPPLHAVDGGVPSANNTPGETHLTLAEVNSVVAAAIGHWAAAGLSDAQIASLQQVTFEIGNLQNSVLGVSAPGHIVLDDDAAGHGWFVDPTPLDNSEFTHISSATRATTDPTTDAAGHMDLLTTLMHELGHQLGLDDLQPTTASEDLMSGYLVTGERRLPDSADVIKAEQIEVAKCAADTEATLPASAQAPSKTLPGAAGNDVFHIGQGGTIVVGGAGADSFVFDAPVRGHPAGAATTHIADYHAGQSADGTDHSVDVAQLDGMHAGDPVNVALDKQFLAALNADWLV